MTEEFKVNGEQVVAKVKEIIHQGNIRRIIIKQQDKVLLEIPVTWAAVGALAALITECTIVVEKKR